MAQVVDTAGKVRANPRTGRQMAISPKDGISALREDLGINNVQQGKPKSVLDESLSDQLSRNAMPISKTSGNASQAITGRIPATISSTQNVDDNSLPTIHTASMIAPQLASESGYKKPDSWRSDETNIHGDNYDEVTWFPWDSAGPTRTNDAYERDMIDNGMSMDYLDNVLRESNTVASALDTTNELSQNDRRDLLDSLTTSIDDGTMDRSHLLSDWMTGSQYYHYVHDLGIPGMPEDQIDVSDDARYSKADEQRLNGFQPYVPNLTYLAGSVIPRIASDTRLLSDHVSNLRTRGLLNDVDYDIHANTGYDNDATFSGRDFDKLKDGYFSQVDKLYDDASNGDAEALSSMIHRPDNGPYTTMVKQTTLPDGSVHYGAMTDVDAVPDTDLGSLIDWDNITFNDDGIPESVETTDGAILNLEIGDDYVSLADDKAFEDWANSHTLYQVGFSDGTSASIPYLDVAGNTDEIGDTDWVRYDRTRLDRDRVDPTSLTVGNPETLNDSGVGAYFSPDMILSDGTRIPFDVAMRIAQDDDPDDTSDGVSYSFQKSGLNPSRLGPIGSILGLSAAPLLLTDSRPRRLMDQIPIDEEGFHVADLPNNVTDWAANSMTISLPYLQWLNAASQAMPYYAGVDGTLRSEGGAYRSTGWDPESDEGGSRNALLSVPTLAGPAFENLAGNIGHETLLDEPVKDLINRRLAKGTLANALAHFGWDMFAEGEEENLGDIVDELGTYGRDAYANPLVVPTPDMAVYDENGNLLKAGGVDFVGPFEALYDERGNEIRDPDTSVDDRIANFIPHTPEQFREAANSFIGGAGVSALMGAPGLLASGIGSKMQRDRGDWGSPAYAAHMDALGRDLPYAGSSLSHARNDMRRKALNSVNGKQTEEAPDIELPTSLVSRPRNNARSDIIPYKPGKYAIPDDIQLPDIK